MRELHVSRHRKALPPKGFASTFNRRNADTQLRKQILVNEQGQQLALLPNMNFDVDRAVLADRPFLCKYVKHDTLCVRQCRHVGVVAPSMTGTHDDCPRCLVCTEP